MSIQKPRECWAIVDNDTGEIKDLRKIGQGGPRSNDHKILMREVVPPPVTISRDMLRTYFETRTTFSKRTIDEIITDLIPYADGE